MAHLPQQRGIPFEGMEAQFETRKVFSQLKIESERASRDLASEYGEPLWCKETDSETHTLEQLHQHIQLKVSW